MLYAVKKPIKLLETVFDILYLVTLLILACVLLFQPHSAGSMRWELGCLALVLAIGDTCHLSTRIRAMWWNTTSDHAAALGLGKMASSVTMTLFYLGLWHIGTVFYEVHSIPLNTLVVFLAVARILLCLLPQNKWISSEKQPDTNLLTQSKIHSWTQSKIQIWRNLPFFFLGLAVMMIFLTGSLMKPYGPSFLWAAVLISFAFYLPVVLFAGKYPKLGMLMLPKSCVYIVIILMGFSLPGG